MEELIFANNYNMAPYIKTWTGWMRSNNTNIIQTYNEPQYNSRSFYMRHKLGQDFIFIYIFTLSIQSRFRLTSSC